MSTNSANNNSQDIYISRKQWETQIREFILEEPFDNSTVNDDQTNLGSSSSRFLMLSGVGGSGKTWLIKFLGKYIGSDDNNLRHENRPHPSFKIATKVLPIESIAFSTTIGDNKFVRNINGDNLLAWHDVLHQLRTNQIEKIRDDKTLGKKAYKKSKQRFYDYIRLTNVSKKNTEESNKKFSIPIRVVLIVGSFSLGLYTKDLDHDWLQFFKFFIDIGKSSYDSQWCIMLANALYGSVENVFKYSIPFLLFLVGIFFTPIELKVRNFSAKLRYAKDFKKHGINTKTFIDASEYETENDFYTHKKSIYKKPQFLIDIFKQETESELRKLTAAGKNIVLLYVFDVDKIDDDPCKQLVELIRDLLAETSNLNSNLKFPEFTCHTKIVLVSKHRLQFNRQLLEVEKSHVFQKRTLKIRDLKKSEAENFVKTLIYEKYDEIGPDNYIIALLKGFIGNQHRQKEETESIEFKLCKSIMALLTDGLNGQIARFPNDILNRTELFFKKFGDKSIDDIKRLGVDETDDDKFKDDKIKVAISKELSPSNNEYIERLIENTANKELFEVALYLLCCFPYLRRGDWGRFDQKKIEEFDTVKDKQSWFKFSSAATREDECISLQSDVENTLMQTDQIYSRVSNDLIREYFGNIPNRKDLIKKPYYKFTSDDMRKLTQAIACYFGAITTKNFPSDDWSILECQQLFAQAIETVTYDIFFNSTDAKINAEYTWLIKTILKFINLFFRDLGQLSVYREAFRYDEGVRQPYIVILNLVRKFIEEVNNESISKALTLNITMSLVIVSDNIRKYFRENEEYFTDKYLTKLKQKENIVDVDHELHTELVLLLKIFNWANKKRKIELKNQLTRRALIYKEEKSEVPKTNSSSTLVKRKEINTAPVATKAEAGIPDYSQKNDFVNSQIILEELTKLPFPVDLDKLKAAGFNNFNDFCYTIITYIRRLHKLQLSETEFLESAKLIKRLVSSTLAKIREVQDVEQNQRGIPSVLSEFVNWVNGINDNDRYKSSTKLTALFYTFRSLVYYCGKLDSLVSPVCDSAAFNVVNKMTAPLSMCVNKLSHPEKLHLIDCYHIIQKIDFYNAETLIEQFSFEFEEKEHWHDILVMFSENLHYLMKLKRTERYSDFYQQFTRLLLVCHERANLDYAKKETVINRRVRLSYVGFGLSLNSPMKVEQSIIENLRRTYINDVLDNYLMRAEFKESAALSDMQNIILNSETFKQQIKTICSFDANSESKIMQEILKLLSMLNPNSERFSSGDCIVGKISDVRPNHYKISIPNSNLKVDVKKELLPVPLYNYIYGRVDATEPASNDISKQNEWENRYILLHGTKDSDNDTKPVTFRGAEYIGHSLHLFFPTSPSWAEANPRTTSVDDDTPEIAKENSVNVNSSLHTNRPVEWIGNLWMGASNSWATLRLSNYYREMLLIDRHEELKMHVELQESLCLARLSAFERVYPKEAENEDVAEMREMRNFAEAIDKNFEVNFPNEDGQIVVVASEEVKKRALRAFKSAFTKIFSYRVTVLFNGKIYD